MNVDPGGGSRRQRVQKGKFFQTKKASSGKTAAIQRRLAKGMK